MKYYKMESDKSKRHEFGMNLIICFHSIIIEDYIAPQPSGNRNARQQTPNLCVIFSVMAYNTVTISRAKRDFVVHNLPTYSLRLIDRIGFFSVEDTPWFKLRITVVNPQMSTIS